MVDCIIFKEADFKYSTVQLENVGLCLLSSLACFGVCYFYNLHSNNLVFFRRTCVYLNRCRNIYRIRSCSNRPKFQDYGFCSYQLIIFSLEFSTKTGFSLMRKIRGWKFSSGTYIKLIWVYNLFHINILMPSVNSAF